MTIASDIRSALANAGAPQTAAEVHAALGDDVPAARIASALSQMKQRGEVQCDDDARPRTYTLDPSYKPTRKRPGEAAQPPAAARKKPGANRATPKSAKGKRAQKGRRSAVVARIVTVPSLSSIAAQAEENALAPGCGDCVVSRRSLQLLTAAVAFAAMAYPLHMSDALREALGEAQRTIAE
jgi:hypothetical protein